MTVAPAETESPAPRPVFSSGYKSVVLSLLLLAYTFNFIDRTIVATIGQAIKVDLKITDTQLGLLGGLSFAVLYTLLGIPIARMAERWNRVSVIALAMVMWSGFTVACGFAGSFVQLLAMRVGVGCRRGRLLAALPLADQRLLRAQAPRDGPVGLRLRHPARGHDRGRRRRLAGEELRLAGGLHGGRRSRRHHGADPQAGGEGTAARTFRPRPKRRGRRPSLLHHRRASRTGRGGQEPVRSAGRSSTW